jgi:hypothetical protein
MGIATANRWVNGKVNVSERKLARAIAAVGADPSAYGIDAALASGRSSSPVDATPKWALEMEARIQRQHAETMQMLGDVLNAIRAK